MTSTAKRKIRVGGGWGEGIQNFLPSHRMTPEPMALYAIIGQEMNHFIEKYI